MAEFGIEAIRYFGNARAAGVSTAGDLSYTFNRANGFDEVLRDAGHTREFYWADTDCFEDDIRDSDKLDVVALAVGIATAVLAILVVRRITDRQLAWARRAGRSESY